VKHPLRDERYPIAEFRVTRELDDERVHSDDSPSDAGDVDERDDDLPAEIGDVQVGLGVRDTFQTQERPPDPEAERRAADDVRHQRGRDRHVQPMHPRPLHHPPEPLQKEEPR
jgi:hypothetical protein